MFRILSILSQILELIASRTYNDFAHFPTSCQAVQDILFGIISTVVINFSDTSPEYVVPKIHYFNYLGDIL